MKKTMSRLGFTLIELLIVITIIGILAVVFIPTVMDAPRKARDAARAADVGNVVEALAAAQLGGVDITTIAGGDVDATVLSSVKEYFSGQIIPLDPQSANDVDGAGAVFTAGKYAVVKYTIAPASKVYIGVFAKVENADNGNTTNCPTAKTAVVLPDVSASTGACFGMIYN